VDTLSGEIDSCGADAGVKPIDRAEIVVGKWLGHLVLALAYLLLVSAGILITMRVVGGLAPGGVSRALPLLMLEITLSLTVAVAGGARFSTVTNAIAAVGFYGVAFIGGFIEQIGGFAGVSSMRTIGVLVSLVSPVDSMWRLAAEHLQPENHSRFSAAWRWAPRCRRHSCRWWAAGFTALTLYYATRVFRCRAL
jgi:ABC-type transport system involved in multi-copper enzyme maturation permease subunit